MNSQSAKSKVQNVLTLAEYNRLYRLAGELGDRAEIDRLQTRYAIDDNGATPKPDVDETPAAGIEG